MIRKLIQLTFLFNWMLFLFGQSFYDGPDDLAGDPSAIRESRMDGNKVLLYFKEYLLFNAYLLFFYHPQFLQVEVNMVG